ncbi:MAG: hypothetical protein GTN86_09465 [Xanthomonadales bacterium]|nr:hypothetical protein [Xanthomonadales bacterium]NIN59702.1 hypothetical protein [Xanthomonadales bacterium]NIN75114.1 hypothetical protein [Xanthomonadales bacterium]NIO13435.1 hypothetical protein [Xanthomonadales bacterium]NIP12095.1 hypothetical protein [Xanthomonadales bacterium]
MKPRPSTLPSALLAAALLVATPFDAQVGRAQTSVNRIALEISGRAVRHDTGTVRVSQGDTVELVWTSDEPGLLHLHGYDLEFEVGPDGPSAYVFEARATGRFPITSHGFGGEQGHGHEALLYLEVYPR